MLALLTGTVFVLARVARLGWVADYFSRPVLIGYIHGIAVVLVIGQLGKLLGVSVSALDRIAQLVEVVRELGEVSGATLVVSGATLAVLFAFRTFVPRFPGTLVVIVLAIPFSSAPDLAAHGVAVVGPIPAGLPSIEVPSASFTEMVKLLPAALGIFVSFADEILTARSFAGRHGRHVRAGPELVAMGRRPLDRVYAGLSDRGEWFPDDGQRLARRADAGVGRGRGGRRRRHRHPPVPDRADRNLPKPVLGAVIVVAAIGLVDRAAWRALREVDAVEFTIAAVTAAGVVVLGS